MSEMLFFLLGAGAVCAVLYLLSRLVGFTAQKPQDYTAGGPEFDLRTHLVRGAAHCEGSSRFERHEVDTAFEGL